MDGSNKKLLIFDFDGTLNMGSDEGYDAVIETALEENDIHPEPDELKQFVERNWGNSPRLIVRDLVTCLIESSPQLTDDKQDLIQAVLASYDGALQRDYAEYIKPIPGVTEMLGRLASSHLLALNTAADEEVLYSHVLPKLEMNSSLDLFMGGMITAKDLESGRVAPKPEPGSTFELMSRNGVAPHETVMIGDSASDILTAAYAGVEDIVVTLTGRLSAEEAETYRQEYGVEVVPDATHLEQLLGRISVRPLAANGY